MIPLLIGNVIDFQRLSRNAKKHNLYLVLDSCDTFGSTFDGNPVGKYADIVTTSFYGSHISIMIYKSLVIFVLYCDKCGISRLSLSLHQ